VTQWSREDNLSSPKSSLAESWKQEAIWEICLRQDMERKMTQNSNDLRARRTRKLLRDALLELIEERGFDALTVEELASRAMVSRSAFYRYYQDKYDLVEQIFEEAMSALLNAVGDLGREHPPEIWVKFFEHIAQYERLYRALLGRKGSPWFVRKMRASLAGLVKERGHLPHGPDASARPVHTFSDEFVPDLVSTMFVEAITWWLEHGRPYTPKEMATRSALLASALFKEASTWQ
jgi:AcrR family transcriptional regulator